MNQSDEQLATALRELAGSASYRQGASPELGLMLKDAFRRHHHRRRRLQRTGFALICVCTALLTASLLSRKSLNVGVTHTAAVHTIPPQQFVSQADVIAAIARRPQPITAASTKKDTPTVADEFVALPSLDMVPANDELRVVRLEMPGEDLRLVGAPVTEEITRRRVTADFLVGHDGTPYAVRLVNSKF